MGIFSVFGCIFIIFFAIDYNNYNNMYNNFYDKNIDSNYIQYRYLSNKINDPIDYKKGLSPRLGVNYDILLLKYSDVRSCLVKSERLKSKPDLRFVDWNSIRDFTSTEICLWRIFSSYGSIESIVEWAKFHGMREVSDLCIGRKIQAEKCLNFSVNLSRYGSLSENNYVQRRLKIFLPWSESIYVKILGDKVIFLNLNFQKI